jgi:hypothetical protein
MREEEKMIGNIKAFGLALAATFALSAVAASIASAGITTGEVRSDGPVTLTGTETGAGGLNAFTAFGAVNKCPGSTYTGHKVQETPHKPVPNNATEVTITPNYVNCTFPVFMNGCHYEFRDATTTGGVEHTYGVVADIECPAGKQIQINGMFGCFVFIPEQTGIIGAHLKTTPVSDDIDLEGAFTNVTAKECLGKQTGSAVLHVDLTIKGHNNLKEETGVTILH